MKFSPPLYNFSFIRFFNFDISRDILKMLKLNNILVYYITKFLEALFIFLNLGLI